MKSVRPAIVSLVHGSFFLLHEFYCPAFIYCCVSPYSAADTEATGDNQADETGTDTRSFMSVVWDQSNRLGLAHYSCQTRELMCSSLYATAPEVPWLLRVVREQVQVPAAAIIKLVHTLLRRMELLNLTSFFLSLSRLFIIFLIAALQCLRRRAPN
jgi:hypothetical protein